MLKVNSIHYHDKKKTKLWNTVLGTYDNVRFIGIVETNKDQTKINWLHVAPALTEEENESNKSKGYESGDDLLDRITNSEKDIIIESVQNHLKAGQ